MTISRCPECGGWAAAHFADQVGMWHDHDGRRVDFEHVEVALANQLQGAVHALELLLPWADGPDEEWMSADDIARRGVALRMARDLIGGQ